jgi:hypothetical protein
MLLYGLAGLTVISAIVGIATYGSSMDAAKDAYAGVAHGDTVVSISRFVGIAAIVAGLLFAALWVVLAAGNLRGKNGLRITTWVFAGLGVLCYGCGAGGSGLSGRFSNSSGSGDANAQQMQDAAQKMQDAIPAWSHAYSIVSTVIGLIACITVIILLALPVSNAYFRKSEPEFVPYPLYPPAPPAV